MKECEQYEMLLSRRIDNDLSPGETSQTAEHLAVCASCRKKAAAYGALRKRLAAHTPDMGAAVFHPMAAQRTAFNRIILQAAAAAASLLLIAGISSLSFIRTHRVNEPVRLPGVDTLDYHLMNMLSVQHRGTVTDQPAGYEPMAAYFSATDL
ncbi:MAG: zf-HC2 domain-containing protein [Spirochaetes bacterium]|nr:zf-HC2 domain-containing protein [Spirochaetota bacterium]